MLQERALTPPPPTLFRKVLPLSGGENPMISPTPAAGNSLQRASQMATTEPMPPSLRRTRSLMRPSSFQKPNLPTTPVSHTNKIGMGRRRMSTNDAVAWALLYPGRIPLVPLEEGKEFQHQHHLPRCQQGSLRRKISDGWLEDGETIKVFRTNSVNQDGDKSAVANKSDDENKAETSFDRQQSSRTCDAVRGAVASLYNLDDFGAVKIGEGFFSEVFKVVHKVSGKVMVLKKNKHRANRNSMLKEVQLMNTLRHKNVLRYEGACVHEGQLHALTEFMNGGNLEQLVQDRARELPWRLRISLALDVARGMEYLHAKGYIHRDLTSKNILLRVSDANALTGVVGDFGLASRKPQQSERLPQVGSPYWMSPECLKGLFYDGKSDVFSFGVIQLESIGRVDADPDSLPRTQNFGVDYVAFAADVAPADAPAEFLRHAFTCVQVDPSIRPDFSSCVKTLENVYLSLNKINAKSSHNKKLPKKSTSNSYIGKEMSRLDPFYAASIAVDKNPFQQPYFPVKLAGPDMFCSCFESGIDKIKEEEGEEERKKKNPPFRKAMSLIDRQHDASNLATQEVLRG